MNKPHVHAALIKAWADGAKIQCLSKYTGLWSDCAPIWGLDFTYRIKPREFPKSSKDGNHWYWAYNQACLDGTTTAAGAFKIVADEVIKQYILDEEAKTK